MITYMQIGKYIVYLMSRRGASQQIGMLTSQTSLVKCVLHVSPYVPKYSAYRFFKKLNLTNVDKLFREKHLHLECQTYIIRFIIRCNFISFYVFGIFYKLD